MRSFERMLFYSVRTSAVLLPAITILGLKTGWSFAGFAVVFGYYFFVEFTLWISGLGVNTTRADEFEMIHPHRPGFLDRFGIEIYSVLHVIAIPVGLYLLCIPGRSFPFILGGVLSLGVMAGSVGGLAGHEFIHRRSKWRRRLGVAVYGSVNYAHFTISHLLGHHQNVGLAKDWSSSRRDESSFHFLGRAFFQGYRAAWRIESAKQMRLGRTGLNNVLHHFMVQVTFAALILNFCAYAIFGFKGWMLYLAISAIAFTLMEMVNYLSHYGLTRRTLPRGNLERVQDRHSWESNNKVTNWFIFNAGKHCHHHRDPHAAHDQLLLSHEKEYIPFGLPLMTLIAFFPPLYFRVMNPLLDRSEVGAPSRS